LQDRIDSLHFPAGAAIGSPMKALVTFVFCVSAMGLQAELDVPRSVYRISQLAEASAKAAKEVKPLIFVYTDPGTT
jgi:hypothetical protein